MIKLNKLLDVLKEGTVSERYSREMLSFLRYMNTPMDQYAVWEEFPNWFRHNYEHDDDAVSWLNNATNGAVDENGLDHALIYDAEPEIFDKMPEQMQKHFMSDIDDMADQKAQYDPSMADTRVHMMLSDTKPLKRQTWLVHFSEYAENIAREGFMKSLTNFDHIGLTKFGLPDYEYSSDGDGYSFALMADSRDADFVAREQKYGSECVIFQNSGVHTYHHGDEEHQIVFYAKDVDPRNIIYMKEIGGDWVVMPHPGKEDRYGRHDDYDLEGGLIGGEYLKMVDWIKKNHRQYAKALYGY